MLRHYYNDVRSMKPVTYPTSVWVVFQISHQKKQQNNTRRFAVSSVGYSKHCKNKMFFNNRTNPEYIYIRFAQFAAVRICSTVFLSHTCSHDIRLSHLLPCWSSISVPRISHNIPPSFTELYTDINHDKMWLLTFSAHFNCSCFATVMWRVITLYGT